MTLDAGGSLGVLLLECLKGGYIRVHVYSGREPNARYRACDAQVHRCAIKPQLRSKFHYVSGYPGDPWDVRRSEGEHGDPVCRVM